MSLRTVLVTILLVASVGARAVSFAASERALVLVTSAESDVPTLSPPEVRRLYLGAPVSSDGQQLEPLRNLSDEALQEVFLQRVVYLSERAYERQIISRVFRLGGKRPVAYENSAALVKALRDSPGAVSYMWADAVPADAGLTVLVELWRGIVE